MAKFKRASADEARAKRKDHIAERGGRSLIIKGTSSPRSWDGTTRSASFVMTSETQDRYGDIVGQAGLSIDRFLENPVALPFHNSRTFPIGSWSDVTKLLSGRPKRTEGKLNFMKEGADPDSDRCAVHVEQGTLRTVSIGFAPNWEEIEFILDDDEDWTGGFRFNESELLECSLVPIPAQPDALVKDAGGDFALGRQLIEYVLDTYVRTPEGLLLPMDEYRAKHLDLIGNATSVVIEKPELEIETKAKDVGDPECDPEDEPEESSVEEDAADEPAEESKAFKEFLAKAANGDSFYAFYKLEGNAGARRTVEKGLSLFRGGECIATIEFRDSVTTEHRAAVAARLLELEGTTSEVAQGKVLLSAEQIESLTRDAAHTDKASVGEEHESMVTFTVLRGDKYLAGLPYRHNALENPADVDIAATTKAIQEALAKKAPPLEAGTVTTMQIRADKVEPIVVDLDMTQATEKLGVFEKALDVVVTKWKSLFGAGVEEKADEPALPAPVPTDEEMSAVLARAEAATMRLAAKGIVEA